MLLRTLPTPLLRTLKKTPTRCIKLAYMQKHGSPCPPYLSKIRDLSILPRILQVNAPWWNLAIDQVAKLLQQEPEDCHQLLALDTRTIDTSVMETIGLSILQYRHTIRQDLPFRLKRLHVWNVSGWTPSQTGNDPKLRLIKRLLRTGPVSLQETRSCGDTGNFVSEYSWTAGCTHCWPPNRKRRDLWRRSCPHPSWLASGQN